MSLPSRTAVLVLGMHRSGTSAVTGVLGLLGVDLGSHLKPAAEDNPRGFWELEPAVAVHDRLLESLARTWDDPRPLPDGWIDSSAAIRAKAELDSIIEAEFGDSSVWAVKDPRLCRFLPLWRDVLAQRNIEARALLVVRDPCEVAGSLQKRNDLPELLGRQLWGRYVADAIKGSAGMPRRLVSYAGLLGDARAVTTELASWIPLGRTVSEDAATRIDEFLSASLRHNHARTTGAFDAIDRFYEALRNVRADSDWEPLEAAAQDFDRTDPVESALGALLDRERAQVADQRTSLTVLQSALDESTRWAQSKDAELLDAIGNVATLESSLRTATEWGTERDRQLRVALERAESLAVELQASGEWGASRDHELNIALERVRELEAHEASAAKVLATMDTLKNELAETRAEMNELSGRLQDEVNEVRHRLDALRAEHQAHVEELTRTVEERGHAVSTLQAGNVHLAARLSALEEALRESTLRRRLSRWVGRMTLSTKIFAKRAIVASVGAMPGSHATRQMRMDALRRLRETVRGGTNGRAILHDLHLLAHDRWPAQPAYLMRTLAEGELPAIDVSVVLFENAQWVAAFVESLLAVDYPLDRVHLHFRDHSRTDAVENAQGGVAEQLRGRLASYRYSRGDNRGFGAGHNHNFGNMQGTVFLVSNVDGRFQLDTLRRLAQSVMTSQPQVAAWELRQIPYEHPKYYDPVTLLTTWVSGACVAFRKDAFAKVRGFDDAIFMYGEDVDLSYRLRAAGFDLAYVPHAVFHHDSYTEPEQFKPLQFHGSTLANALLRLRFGTWQDIAAIPFMWRQLGLTARQLGQTHGYRRNVKALLRLAPRFLLSRPGLRRIRVPFQQWDYGLRRDGAFEFIELPRAEVPVSIVVRTYQGREGLLRQALASIANQTYRNVEAVVVEDKGDSLAATVEAAGSQLGLQVRYFSCTGPDSNRCLTGTRGLDEARGQYVCFLDDDDLLFADHVEYLVSRLEAHPQAAACYALAWESRVVPDPTRPGALLEVMHSSIPGHRRNFDRATLALFNYMPIQTVMFRRHLYQTYGGFDLRLENLEDWELWRRYSMHADFQYCPKTTSVYHVPHDPEVQARRQGTLDAYFPIAHEVADEARRRFERLGTQ